jgi:uncharacterized delta-60 repeat protein
MFAMREIKYKRYMISFFMVLFLTLDSSTEAESAPSFFTQDKKFGTKGSLLLKNFDVFQKEQLQDGSILLAGGTYPSSSNSIDLILVKISANGKLVRNFGNKGIFQTKLYEKENNAQIFPRKILVNSQNEIYLFGSTYNKTSKIGTIVKINSLGKLASNFGQLGISLLKIEDYELTDIITGFVNSDNSVILGGSTQKYGFESSNNPRKEVNSEAVIAKLNPQGVLDSSFNNVGYKKIKFSNSVWESSRVLQILRDASGNYIILGEVSGGDQSKVGLYLMKLNSNLDPINSFGNQSIVKIDLSNSIESTNLLDAKLFGEKILLNGSIQLKNNSSIEVSNSTTVNPSYRDQGFIGMISIDGKLDQKFGSSGLIINTSKNSSNYWISSQKLKDNSYLYIGEQWSGGIDGDRRAFFSILKPDGQIDLTFGQNGVVSFSSKASKILSYRPLIDPKGYLYLSSVNNSCVWCGTEVKKYSFKP